MGDCERAIRDFTIAMDTYSKTLYKVSDDMKKERIASIPGDVDEQIYAPSATTLQVPPQTRNIIRVTAIIFQLTSTGNLQVGPRNFIGLNTGLYTWFGLHWILRYDDPRIITQQSLGVLSLELMGESLVETGMW